MERETEKENRQLRLETGSQTPHEDTIDLEDLFYHLLAGWKLIVALALVFTLGAGYYATRMVVPLYRATSSVYILSSDSVINMSDIQLGSALANDYLEMFSMWEVHDKVISNLGLPYSYGYMRSCVSVSNPDSTRILKISFTSASPKEAATIANEYAVVISDYIEDVMSTERPHIMSSAQVPTSPVSPNKSRIIMLGFLGGAFLGIALLTLRFLLDDKIKTAAEIRKYTGLANLATIPLDTAGFGKSKEGRKK